MLSHIDLAQKTKLSIEFNDPAPEEKIKKICQQSEHLTGLEIIYCQFPNDVIAHLTSLTALTDLNLAGNKITSEGVKMFASPNFSSLTKLNLTRNPIGDEGAATLARTSTQLVLLTLSDCDIQNDGAWALASSKSITGLNLSSNRITPHIHDHAIDNIKINKWHQFRLRQELINKLINLMFVKIDQPGFWVNLPPDIRQYVLINFLCDAYKLISPIRKDTQACVNALFSNKPALKQEIIDRSKEEQPLKVSKYGISRSSYQICL